MIGGGDLSFIYYFREGGDFSFCSRVDRIVRKEVDMSWNSYESDAIVE